MEIYYGSKWGSGVAEIQQHNYSSKGVYFFPVYKTDILQYDKKYCVAIWKIKYKRIPVWDKIKLLFKKLFQ